MAGGHGESKVAVIAAVAANFIIAMIKFAAGALTGSSAMLAEGIHSLVDTGNGGLVLVGMKRSTIPPDAEHPYGHGKSLYFWTFIVAISIFGIGGGMSVYEGISHLRHSAGPIEDPTINYIVLAISFIVEGSSFFVALKTFNHLRGKRGVREFVRTSKDPSLFTIVFEDTAAMLGLVIAFLGVFLGYTFQNPVFDAGASILIGIILMVVAFSLARESKGLLLGEGVEPDVLARMRAAVLADPQVEALGEIKSVYFGPHDLLVTLDAVFSQGLTVDELHEAITRVEEAVKAVDEAVVNVYIEVESARDLAAWAEGTEVSAAE